jgi:hypothetical protein
MVTPLSSGTSIQIGTHILQYDGRILSATFRGDLPLAQNLEILAQYQALVEHHGYVLILMHVAESTGIDMNARKAAAEWGKTYHERCRSAVVGAPFVIRIVLELMNRATNLLSGQIGALKFVATEEEARGWLLAQIPKLENIASTRKSAT